MLKILGAHSHLCVVATHIKSRINVRSCNVRNATTLCVVLCSNIHWDNVRTLMHHTELRGMESVNEPFSIHKLQFREIKGPCYTGRMPAADPPA